MNLLNLLVFSVVDLKVSSYLLRKVQKEVFWIAIRLLNTKDYELILHQEMETREFIIGLFKLPILAEMSGQWNGKGER